MPITNTAWVRAQLCKLQKGCTRLAAVRDKVYQLLTRGRWFSPGTPDSSITKTCRHDIVVILLKVALNTKNSNSNSNYMRWIKSNTICLKEKAYLKALCQQNLGLIINVILNMGYVQRCQPTRNRMTLRNMMNFERNNYFVKITHSSYYN
jgi:hypothetical protein